MRRVIGALMLAAPFVAIFIWSGLESGWGEAVQAFAITLGIVFWIITGAWLLVE